MSKLILKGANVVWTGTVGRGGHIMYALQWLHGLRLLGHEVLYYDRIDNRPESALLFGQIMERWWDRRLAVAMRPTGEAVFGPSVDHVEAFARDAAGIITLGCQFSAEPDPWLASVRPRVLIDLDPGFSQLWSIGASTIEDILGRHDLYFTVGSNIGSARSSLPTLGIDWRPIWNPVITEWWKPAAPRTRDRFTTIAGLWLNAYQSFQGVMWGPKAEELKRFLCLPALAGESIEIALESESGDDLMGKLRQNGWRIESAEAVASTPESYMEYVAGSAGEFSCAKGLYVGAKSGWFSDRSACFLAAGRPVVIQDTGIQAVLPTGAGLFPVATVEEAADAIHRVRRDYQRQSMIARQIALDHFDARRVLPPFLEAMGING
ncbi:MAG: glycosyltransferase [Candidatus Binatia bacterium]